MSLFPVPSLPLHFPFCLFFLFHRIALGVIVEHLFFCLAHLVSFFLFLPLLSASSYLVYVNEFVCPSILFLRRLNSFSFWFISACETCWDAGRLRLFLSSFLRYVGLCLPPLSIGPWPCPVLGRHFMLGFVLGLPDSRSCCGLLFYQIY